MTLKRLIILFILPVIMFLLWSSAVLAAAGDPVRCDLDENKKAKRELAVSAQNNLARAHNRLKEIVNSLEDNYKNPNGVCNYLEGTFGKWWDEATTSQLGYTDSAKSGAKIADEIIKNIIDKDTSCENIIAETNKFSSYTDWNISDLKKRAQEGSGKMNFLAQWAETAKVGQYIQVTDSEAKKNICKSVGGCTSHFTKNSCDYIFKTASGKIDCVDSYGLHLPKEDGKCYKNKDVIDCYDNDHIATSFASVDDFKNKLTSSDSNVTKCLEVLDNLERKRGNADDPNSFIGARKLASNALATLSGEVNSECYCEADEEGKATDKLIKCTAHDSDFVENNMADECLPIDQYLFSLQDNCITCKLFARLIGTVQKIAQNSFEKMADVFVKLLGIALLLFLGYTVLITIASPEQQKLSKFLNTLFKQSAKVAIAVLILQSPLFIYNMAINPILEGSIDFGATLSGTNKASIEEIGKKYIENFDIGNKYITVSTAQSLTGTVENFGKDMVIMPAIGRSLWCHAWSDLQLYIFPHFKMMFIGAMFYIFGIGIWLAVGFYILDCAIQLGLACAMMPFFIASWPFKLTNRYAVTGWNIFINVIFNFIMMGIIVSVITALSAQSLSVGRTTEELIQVINNNSVNELENILEIGGLQMVFIVVCCLMCYKLSKESKRLANKFAGGAQVSMGAALAGLAGSTIQSAAIGNMGKKDKNGKRQGAGGALGLAKKGAGKLLGSAAEHSGAKGLYNQQKAKVTGGLKKFTGKLGVGSKAGMLAKGRDENANNADNEEASFKPDGGGEE